MSNLYRIKHRVSLYRSCIDAQTFRFQDHFGRFGLGQKHIRQHMFDLHHGGLDLNHVLFTLVPFAPGIPNRVIVLVVVVEGQDRLSGPGRTHTDVGEGRNVEDLLVNSNEARHYTVRVF